jgi:3-oxoacyl-[acyl-carrier-protein] synthase-3
MTREPIAMRVFGSGEYLPETVMYSDEFDARWQKPDGWTLRSVGVQKRHIASPAETSSSMGVSAARQALQAAGTEPGEIDCIVSACSVMEQAIPCLATQIQSQLGLGESGIPAFDVNATCLGFVVALDLLSCAIATGRYRKVLIVSSEIASAGLNPDDQGTAALFGDGAAAVVVGPSPQGCESSLLATHLATFGSGSEYCQVRAGGTKIRAEVGFDAYVSATKFEMDGKATYRLAARHLPSVFAKLLSMAQVTVGDLACIVPHQASGKAIGHLASVLGLPQDRVVRTIQDRGNQIAASIPSALHHAISRGLLRRGQLVALLGTGAGLSMGGAVLRY